MSQKDVLIRESIQTNKSFTDNKQATVAAGNILFENGYVLGEIVAADIYGNLSDKRDNAKDFQAPVWGDNTEISFGS